MDDREFKKYFRKHLAFKPTKKRTLKEGITWENRKPGEPLPTMKDYQEAYDKKSVEEDVYRGDEWMGDPNAPSDTVSFDEFMNNLQNYSTDTDRDKMLTFLIKFIIKMDHPESYFIGLMKNMAYEFERNEDGTHIENI